MADITDLPVGTYVTQKGYRLITKLLAADGSLEFTRAAVGTGKLQNGVNPETLIDLVSYRLDAQIGAYGMENDQAYINVQLSSEGITEGFLATEVGVFARDPDEGEILYSYMDISGDPTYIYAEGTSSVLKFAEFTMYMLIGSLTKVTAVISAGSFVSRELFDGTIEKLRKELEAKGCVKIGPADTELSLGETLFIVGDGLPDVPVTINFEGAAYTNMVFAAEAPGSGNIENWGQTESDQAAAASAESEDGLSVIEGKLVVSEEASSDAAFFAKIIN